MPVFITSDHHFFHDNVIPFCGRPFRSIHGMEETLVSLHNAVVSDSDDVFFLGDVMMASCSKAGALENILGRMRGRKYLVTGNHDRLPVRSYLKMGFEEVWTRTTIRVNGHSVLLVHDPGTAIFGARDAHIYRSENRGKRSHREALGEFMSFFGGSGPVFCGHWHQRFLKIGGCVNAGVDAWGFGPVEAGTLLDLALCDDPLYLSSDGVGDFPPNWRAPHLEGADAPEFIP